MDAQFRDIIKYFSKLQLLESFHNSKNYSAFNLWISSDLNLSKWNEIICFHVFINYKMGL